MKSLSQIMDQAMVLKSEISKLLLASTYKECSDLSGLDINYGDSEQLLQLEVLRDITEKLADIEATLNYMSLPVVEGGQLIILFQSGDFLGINPAVGVGLDRHLIEVI